VKLALLSDELDVVRDERNVVLRFQTRMSGLFENDIALSLFMHFRLDKRCRRLCGDVRKTTIRKRLTESKDKQGSLVFG
jgi:succinate dehydrogenase flavin-adding protein (antitoxin of CptAB toxin-antitoxin module)